MPAINNPKHERFAQLVSIGWPKGRAYQESGPTRANYKSAHEIGSRLSKTVKVKKRVAELQIQRRRALELSAEDILDDTLAIVDLATAAGQYSAALAGMKMVDSATHKQFVDRKETINLDLKLSNTAEIERHVLETYGNELGAKIIAQWKAKHSNTIEHEPQKPQLRLVTDTNTETE